MDISSKIGTLAPSATLSLKAKAEALKAEGHQVISLAVGEPDFPPPTCVVKAAHQALKDNKSKYTPAAGVVELREKIAHSLNEQHGLSVSAANIVVSTGGKQALHNVFEAILEPGDEVLLPCPWWVSYPPLIQLAGGRVVEVPMPQSGFIDCDALEKKITKKSKVLILNSPSNPSGQVISKSELDRLEEIVIRHNLIIVSDELYASLVYGVDHLGPASRDQLKERTVTIGGFSKCFSITGWRVGYSVTPQKVAKAIAAYQSHTTSNANSIAQYAILNSLEEAFGAVEVMRQAFDKRRQMVVAGLREIDGIDCQEPQGAFYAFPCVKQLMERKGIQSDLDFSQNILEKLKVAVVPGSAFGTPGYFRLSYAASDDELKEALRRFKESFS